jgi:hypothetical protein
MTGYNEREPAGVQSEIQFSDPLAVTVSATSCEIAPLLRAFIPPQ